MAQTFHKSYSNHATNARLMKKMFKSLDDEPRNVAGSFLKLSRTEQDSVMSFLSHYTKQDTWMYTTVSYTAISTILFKK